MHRLAYLLAIVAISVRYSCNAQDISLTSIERSGDMVFIQYSLEDENPGRTYTIYLYSSKDNFISPLEEVKGDVGVDVSLGANRRIIWNAKKELGDDFKGDLSLEIKGSIYVPFISLNTFETDKVVKRTEQFDVIWSGGRGDNVLLFELYKGDKKVYVFEERPNVGNTKLNIPRKIKPGKNYRLKISDTSNQDEIVFSNEFEVKRKIPQAIQLGGAAILGAAATVLIINAIPPPDIPEPPNPEDN